jgi:molecular chaperone IbpA
MGLAGWDRDSIKITQDKGTLTIEGVDKQELNIEKGERYLYKGISGKTFRKVFTLGEYVNVSEADFSDGMLTVNLRVDPPESEQPKLININ